MKSSPSLQWQITFMPFLFIAVSLLLHLPALPVWYHSSLHFLLFSSFFSFNSLITLYLFTSALLTMSILSYSFSLSLFFHTFSFSLTLTFLSFFLSLPLSNYLSLSFTLFLTLFLPLSLFLSIFLSHCHFFFLSLSLWLSLSFSNDIYLEEMYPPPHSIRMLHKVGLIWGVILFDSPGQGFSHSLEKGRATTLCSKYLLLPHHTHTVVGYDRWQWSDGQILHFDPRLKAKERRKFIHFPMVVRCNKSWSNMGCCIYRTKTEMA